MVLKSNRKNGGKSIMEANNFKRFKKQSPLYRLCQRGSLDVLTWRLLAVSMEQQEYKPNHYELSTEE